MRIRFVSAFGFEPQRKVFGRIAALCRVTILSERAGPACQGRPPAKFGKNYVPCRSVLCSAYKQFQSLPVLSCFVLSKCILARLIFGLKVLPACVTNTANLVRQSLARLFELGGWFRYESCFCLFGSKLSSFRPREP